MSRFGIRGPDEPFAKVDVLGEVVPDNAVIEMVRRILGTVGRADDTQRIADLGVSNDGLMRDRDNSGAQNAHHADRRAHAADPPPGAASFVVVIILCLVRCDDVVEHNVAQFAVALIRSLKQDVRVTHGITFVDLTSIGPGKGIGIPLPGGRIRSLTGAVQRSGLSWKAGSLSSTIASG